MPSCEPARPHMSASGRGDPNGLRADAHVAPSVENPNTTQFDPRWVPHLPSNPVPRGPEAGEFACLFNLLRDPRFQRIRQECPSPANVLAAETDSCALSYLTDLCDFLEQAELFAGEEAPAAFATARAHTRAVVELLRERVSEIYMRVVFKEHPDALTAFDQTRRGFGPGVDLSASIRDVADDIIREQIRHAVRAGASTARRQSAQRAPASGRGFTSDRGRGGAGRHYRGRGGRGERSALPVART